MPIDPTTGRIISSSSLTLSETDELQIPRNSQIGPSRTAQNRKQLRTAFLQNVLASRSEFANAIANNPLILQLIADVERLEAQEIQTRVFAGENIAGAADFNIDRQENINDDVLYYGIQGEYNLVVSGDTVGIEIDFQGATHYHNVSAVIEVASSPGPNADNEVTFFEDSGTDGTVDFSVGIDPGTTYIHITLTGVVASFSETATMRISPVVTGDTPVIAANSNGSCVVQLTNQTFLAP